MYDWLKIAYPLNFATLEQCKEAVARGKITKEEFKEITKEEYVGE